MSADTVKPEKEPDYVVIDSGKTSFRDLYTKEDWMAIWMGFFLLIAGLFIFLPNPPEKMNENLTKYNAVLKEEAAKAPFKTIEWHNASASKRGIRATNQDFARTISSFLASPGDWKTNPVDALYRSKETADAMNASGKAAFEKAKGLEDETLARAKIAQAAAAVALFKDAALNDTAIKEIKLWQDAKGKASSAKSKSSVKPYNRVPYLYRAVYHPGCFFRDRQGHHGPVLRKVFLGILCRFLSCRARLHGRDTGTDEALGVRLPALGHRLRPSHQQHHRNTQVGEARCCHRVLH